ncbi:MAG: hypothetical protein A2W25_13655 [candidate division Zixibacteria bacterium RBG_16_53_22]|nr:MAG: hypothetical protein A2W25_13655 [candidate division Zixibacteria bacterium RBG_16_53_22]
MKILMTAVVVLAWAASLSALIINVPAEYATIQAGIDASADGDTVLVAPGTYHERINFNGHACILASRYYTTGDTTFIGNTIIDGDSLGTVVVFENGENQAVLAGFTVQYGLNYGGLGGGIRCLNSSPQIVNNVIRWNASSVGAGIYCNQSNSVIAKNEIHENVAIGYGGGIHCVASSPTIVGNTISGNWSYY